MSDAVRYEVAAGVATLRMARRDNRAEAVEGMAAFRENRPAARVPEGA